MTEVAPTAPTPTTPPPQFATGWQRTGAGIIDTIVCIIIQSVLSILIQDAVQALVAYLFLSTIYYIATEALHQQATLGKRLLSLYVASRTHQRPSLSILAWRYVLWMLPALPMLYFMLSLDVSAVEERLSNTTSRDEINQVMHDPSVMMHLIKFTLSSLLATVGCIFLYFIPMFFTKERTGLHDWLSGTRVYQGKPQPAPSVPSTPDAAA